MITTCRYCHQQVEYPCGDAIGADICMWVYENLKKEITGDDVQRIDNAREKIDKTLGTTYSGVPAQEAHERWLHQRKFK